MKITYVIFDGSKVYHIYERNVVGYYIFKTVCGTGIFKDGKLTSTKPRNRRLCKACARARGKG